MLVAMPATPAAGANLQCPDMGTKIREHFYFSNDMFARKVTK